MHRVPAVIVAIVALVLTASSAAQVADDHAASTRWGPPCSDTRDPTAGPCLFLGAPVVNAPFSADVVTTWQPPAGSGTPEMRATARYYRDRHGRLRVEQTYVGGTPGRVLVTVDPAGRRMHVLDPLARTAYRSPRGAGEMMAGGGGTHRRFVLPLGPNRWMSFLRLPSPSLHFNTPFDEQPLGERVMAGVRVTGTAYTATLPAGAFGRARSFEMRDERWVSPELSLVVFSRGEDPHIGVFDYRLVTISRDDPPADLFTVPVDFTEMEPAGTLTWENPYTLAERRARTSARR